MVQCSRERQGERSEKSLMLQRLSNITTSHYRNNTNLTDYIDHHQPLLCFRASFAFFETLKRLKRDFDRRRGVIV